MKEQRLALLNRIKNLGVTIGLLMIITPLTVSAGDVTGFSVHFHPVGTPEFMGAPKIGQPGFVPPIAEIVYEPAQAKCLVEKKSGEYEALIEPDGSVSTFHSHYEPITGDECEKKYLIPYIMKWHFKPATFNGKPTPVYMWFGLGL